jgi:hypothetical protein
MAVIWDMITSSRHIVTTTMTRGSGRRWPRRRSHAEAACKRSHVGEVDKHHVGQHVIVAIILALSATVRKQQQQQCQESGHTVQGIMHSTTMCGYRLDQLFTVTTGAWSTWWERTCSHGNPGGLLSWQRSPVPSCRESWRMNSTDESDLMNKRKTAAGPRWWVREEEDLNLIGLWLHVRNNIDSIDDYIKI